MRCSTSAKVDNRRGRANRREIVSQAQTNRRQVIDRQSTEPQAASAPARAKRPLFLQRRFWPIWTTLSLGTFADNTLRQALLIGIPYGVVSTPGFNNPDNAMPIIGALLPLAILLFSPLAGQLADKYETAAMMRRTKFAEIGLMAVAAFAFAAKLGGLAIFMLFAMGAQSAFFSPVRVSAMPKYLATDELVRGNGLCNAGLFGFILLGYGVGGALIVQPDGGLKVGATLVTAASLGFAASLFAPAIGANAPDLKLRLNWFALAIDMVRLTARAPGVAPPLIGFGAFFLLTTAVSVLTPLLARDTLNGDALTATALNGLFALGVGVGAIVAAALPKTRTNLGVAGASVIAAGGLTIAIALAAPAIAPSEGELQLSDLIATAERIAFCLALVATAALMGVYIAPLQAAMQRRAPTASRARIMAVSAIANAAFAIPGSLSVLLITRTNAPPEAGLIGVGVGMLAIGGVMARRRNVLPAGRYDEAFSPPSN
ncbi:MAG: MFS transporter [Pseudomonadota bacterium]